MKKAVFIFLIITLPILTWAQDFDSAVAFSVELSDLSRMSGTDSAAEDGRIVILEGISGDVILLDDRPWLRLLGGEWIGTEEVRAYTCLFAVEDERWLQIFPVTRPEDPGLAYVPPGSRLLIAARILGWNNESEEPVAEILEYRVLK